MNGYAYSPVTGEFLGVFPLRESPLEPGVFLVPANATKVAPMQPEAGHVARWNGSAWEQVEDHRGKTFYDQDGLKVIIHGLGPVPAGLSAALPPPSPAALERMGAAVRTERDGLLSSCDWTQLADAPLSSEVKAAWATYRQALRDVTSQAGFPTSVVWPVAPGA